MVAPMGNPETLLPMGVCVGCTPLTPLSAEGVWGVYAPSNPLLMERGCTPVTPLLMEGWGGCIPMTPLPIGGVWGGCIPKPTAYVGCVGGATSL